MVEIIPEEARWHTGLEEHHINFNHYTEKKLFHLTSVIVMGITDSLYFYLQPLINEYKKIVLVCIRAYMSTLTMQPAFYTLHWREDFHNCTAQWTQTQEWIAAGERGAGVKAGTVCRFPVWKFRYHSYICSHVSLSLAVNKLGHMSQRIKYRPQHKSAAGKQKKTAWPLFVLTEIAFWGAVLNWSLWKISVATGNWGESQFFVN